MNKFSSKKIRKDFIEFFKKKEHSFVRSSPVMPIDDETLLFTNAGMNQFKKIFLGSETASSKRVVNSQKCIRVSGKHNDLEEVGADEFHHTFFEMLGNWSFGDFYKKEIIQWSWELLTEVWKLDKNRLWVTVYKDDDEAKDLWLKHTDVNPERVLKFGKKDNFWEMGETGPCGPCSEIHYYVGSDLKKQNKEGVNREDEYRELWNLVFIEYNRNIKGELVDLPLKHVDTGAGLERIVSTLNNTTDHYKTDLFNGIIKKIEQISGKNYCFQNGMPHRVIADHLRMVSFSLADGIMPSNEGRGYVVRRILRRAIRFGRVLDINNEFLYDLVDELLEILGDAYPELIDKKDHIKKVIKSEEISFGRTLDKGLLLFDDIVNKEKTKFISGEDAFKLYDTYGFPLDLTQLLAKERNLIVKVEAFDILMAEQKNKARDTNKFSNIVENEDWKKISEIKNNSNFLGYTNYQCKSKISMYRFKKNKVEIVLSQTPFYAESGGQIGDTGMIESDDFIFKVEDTYKDGDCICHLGSIQKGLIDDLTDKDVISKIDINRRERIKVNHTSTHLLHKALKIVLGNHVQQAGSLVADDKLRFDLTHYQKITIDELNKIEDIVNDIIRDNILLDVSIKSFDDAKKSGAEALFGEKYGDNVRVVDIEGFSKELCGGTHINATGDIGLFKIISESSLSTGVRRIEAITGKDAFEYLRSKLVVVRDIANNFNCKDQDVAIKISEMTKNIKIYKNEITQMNNKAAKIVVTDLYDKKEVIKNISFINGPIKLNIAPKDLNDISLNILSNRGISLLALLYDDKNILVCSVTKDLSENIMAGSILKKIANSFDLKAGGSNHMAIMSFKEKNILLKALDVGKEIIIESIEKYDK